MHRLLVQILYTLMNTEYYYITKHSHVFVSNVSSPTPVRITRGSSGGLPIGLALNYILVCLLKFLLSSKKKKQA